MADGLSVRVDEANGGRHGPGHGYGPTAAGGSGALFSPVGGGLSSAMKDLHLQPMREVEVVVGAGMDLERVAAVSGGGSGHAPRPSQLASANASVGVSVGVSGRESEGEGGGEDAEDDHNDRAGR